MKQMRFVLSAVALVTFFAAIMVAQDAGTASAAKKATAPHAATKAQMKQSAPNAGADEIKAFDVTAMDKSADPCQDFYQFACGGWISSHPIPADQGSYGRFTELANHNRDLLHEILEAAAKPGAGRNPVDTKIGDFYAACMDEEAINKRGAEPLQPEMQRIEQVTTPDQLLAEVARLHERGVPAMFRFGQTADFHNAHMTIAGLDQGGTGLPNKDYYTKTDPKSVETREKYVQHIQNMLQLVGDSPDKAASEAKEVMDIETKLAAASLDPVAMRNPSNRDHPMTKEEVAGLAPNLQFVKYVQESGAPAFDKVNVSNPDFIKQVNSLLTEVPVEQWKQYLRWNLVRATAPYLSKPFEEENFNFNNAYMGGAREMQVRWKRCVQLTDQNLGELLGQPYVKEYFGAQGKARTLEMVKAIEQAMGQDLQKLPWMSDTTKKAAAVKLSEVANKIGYPDVWRNYAKLRVDRSDFAGNMMRSREFEYDRNINKIGQAVNRQEWTMSPPTVNAYYNSGQNNINFPAGILQPPFYSNKADDAVNFGGIGAVIGHELTHGFDDSGARFDGNGDLRDWWTKQDEDEFHTRTECLAHEYDQFVAVDDVHVNGHLTLGENTADNGGLRISLMALHNKDGVKQTKIEGFTPEQRFFLTFAQIWCENQSPAAARRQALTNPHSPGKYRVQGPLQNMPEFQQAFSCKAGDKMVSANPCRIW